MLRPQYLIDAQKATSLLDPKDLVIIKLPVLAFRSKQGIWVKPNFAKDSSQKVRLLTLLDTGSVYNLCPATLLPQAKRRGPIPKNLVLTGASGKRLPGVCLADFEMTLGDKPMGMVRFYVFDPRTVPLQYAILGLTTLRKMNCKIDVGGNFLRWKATDGNCYNHQYNSQQKSSVQNLAQGPTRTLEWITEPGNGWDPSIPGPSINQRPPPMPLLHWIGELSFLTNSRMGSHELQYQRVGNEQNGSETFTADPDGQVSRIREDLIDVSIEDNDIVRYDLDPENITIGSNIPDFIKQQTQDLVAQYLDIFAKDSDEIGRVPSHLFEAEVKVKPDKYAWTAKWMPLQILL